MNEREPGYCGRHYICPACGAGLDDSRTCSINQFWFFSMSMSRFPIAFPNSVGKGKNGGAVRIMPERYYECSKCGNRGYKVKKRFCSVCGAPMTDEAVEMVMERMEALHDNRT